MVLCLFAPHVSEDLRRDVDDPHFGGRSRDGGMCSSSSGGGGDNDKTHIGNDVIVWSLPFF